MPEAAQCIDNVGSALSKARAHFARTGLPAIAAPLSIPTCALPLPPENAVHQGSIFYLTAVKLARPV